MTRAALLSWYDRHKRDLPWRRTQDPWAIWVSEVMCQQTRVESVIPYWERFMARFPTPTALAEAPLDELLGLWAGLGYYARARNLHAAAVQIVAEHGGQVPQDPTAFRALSGVGRYTCGAVQSIAFGHPLPVLDGNVIRVLCRLDNLAEDPRRGPTNRALWARAEALAQGERPGDLNQALMELGATVCTPRSPTCLLCPLQAECKARAAGDPARLPLKPVRKKPPTEVLVAGYVRDDHGQIWLGQRPTDGLLGGLWELPAVQPPAPGPEALDAIGLSASGPATLVKHAFTHRIWQLHVYAATGVPRCAAYDRIAAWPQDSLPALSGPALKALRAVGVPLAKRRGAGR